MQTQQWPVNALRIAPAGATAQETANSHPAARDACLYFKSEYLSAVFLFRREDWRLTEISDIFLGQTIDYF
ncbi:MAG TPA: hypothetical protein VHK27_10170 [Gammaproteobacteria bacterium]|nr:hypothetical protein [Gammaproteobacteria bacterium]